MTTTIRGGDRIKLIAMADDPDPVPAGSTGTVESVTDGPLGQVWVRWDSGRSLALVPGVDRFEVIERGPETEERAGPTPVVVPRNVYAGLLAIRASGLTNMLDRPMVTKLATRMGFREAARWLADPDNRKAYAEGIFRGFAPEKEGDRK
jgi:hypothetical protein